MLLILMLLLSVSSAFADTLPTVWWRTQAGEVIEDHDRVSGKIGCWLTLNDDQKQASFSWLHGDTYWLTVTDPSWNFGVGNTMPVMVSIGEQWINHGPSRALARGSSIILPLSEDVAPLLADAKDVTVVTENAGTNIKINRAKIGKLMEGLRKCRASPRVQRGDQTP